MTAPSVSIRKAEPHDSIALTAIVRASSAYRGPYARMLDGYAVTSEQIARDLVYVAEDDGGIVGFYALTTATREPEVDLLFVVDAEQRRGIGALLIRHLRGLAQSLGIADITIVSHPPAEGFYRRAGARRVGTRAPSGAVTWERPVLKIETSELADRPRFLLETERLFLSQLDDGDAAFIVELLNDPDWLRYIGDKGVRTEDDARGYIRKGPIEMYARHGFGLWRVERKSDGARVGICGLIKRDTLDDVDIGFAFLPAYRGQGYAREAAAATLAHARDAVKLSRVVAIVSPANEASSSLLERLGFRFERMLKLTDKDEVKLFGIAL